MFWFEGWRLIVGKKGASSIVNKKAKEDRFIMFWFEGWRLIVGKKGASSIVNKGSIKKIQNSEVRIQESEEMRITECGMKKTGIKV